MSAPFESGMNGLIGKVGDRELRWLRAPRGPVGIAHVQIGKDQPIEVRYRKDQDGLWLELPHGMFGFDLSAQVNDDGVRSYQVRERGTSQEWMELRFDRGEGAIASSGAQSGKKKGTRVRAQMPGKIIRVLVKAGDEVTKNQSLLVMEAMKMENEIRAAADGRVKSLNVQEGQAVESGADLLVLE
jgi:biotin carboxyl carrier protein